MPVEERARPSPTTDRQQGKCIGEWVCIGLMGVACCGIVQMGGPFGPKIQKLTGAMGAGSGH